MNPFNLKIHVFLQLMDLLIHTQLMRIRVRLVTQACLTLCNSMDCSLPGSSVHGDSPDKNAGVSYRALSRGSSQPRDRPRSPALQVDPSPSEPPGKTKVKVSQSCLTLCDPGQDTGVGSQFLLQGIFLTLASNPGLPHCWQILYQLSHQESTYTYSTSVASFLFLPFSLWVMLIIGVLYILDLSSLSLIPSFTHDFNFFHFIFLAMYLNSFLYLNL